MSNTTNPLPKTIAIDLRGLNFEKRTGINTYTLHALHQLHNELFSKNKPNRDVRIVGIGLFDSVYNDLIQDFEWFAELFDERVSLLHYLNNGWIEKSLKALPKRWHTKTTSFAIRSTNMVLMILNYLGIITMRSMLLDYVWLPQPRPILIHPKTKLVTVFHDLYGVHKPKKMKPVERIREGRRVYRTIIKRSNEVWCDTFATSKDVIETFKIPNPKVRWVSLAAPNWLEIGLISKPSEVLMTNDPLNSWIHKVPYILAIASDIPRKNLSTIITGFLIHHRHHNKDLHLVIIGSISNRRLQLLVPEDLQHLIHIIPDANESIKQIVIQNAKILVYTSLWEGFGFPILEAFQQRIPVITSLNSGMKELGYNASMLIDPYDPKELSDAIAIIEQDTKFKKKLIQAGTQRLLEYTWQEVGNNWSRLLGL